MPRRVPVFITCLLVAPLAMAIDLATGWDFSNPQFSEQRLRTELAKSSGDDALILTTRTGPTLAAERPGASGFPLFFALDFQ